MATSNLAIAYLNADSSQIIAAQSHRMQVWDPAIPINATLTTALNTYADHVIAISSTGSVGIGKTAPNTILDITGTLKAGTLVGNGSLLTNVSTGGGSDDKWGVSSDRIYTSCNVGIGTQTPIAELHIVGNGISNIFQVESGLNNIMSMYIDPKGNIGFGTATSISGFDIYYSLSNLALPYPPGPTQLYPYGPIYSVFSGCNVGNGTYVRHASTTNFYAPNFNYSGVDGDQWSSSTGLYNTSSGAYLGSVSTSGYLGEWIQFTTLNQKIVVSSYDIRTRISTARGDPKTWRLYASNDETTWIMLDERTTQTFTSGQTRNFVISNNQTAYSYYRIVFNQTTPYTSASYVSVLSMTFYGYPAPRKMLHVNDNSIVFPEGSKYDMYMSSPVSEFGSGTGHTLVDFGGVSIAAERYLAGLYSTNPYSEITHPANGPTNGMTSITTPSRDCIRFQASDIDHLTFTDTGSIGIGTTTPRRPIEVNGATFYYGSVGIGTIPPNTSFLRVEGKSFFAGNVGIGLINNNSSWLYQLQLSADFAAKPSDPNWSTTSDPRLKEDIQVADYDLCYSAVSNLDLKYYKWRDDIEIIKDIPDRHKLGWIADEVQQVFPKAVRTIPEMYGLSNVLDLNVDQIYAAMYGAIKKLMARVETLRARYNAGIAARQAAQAP